jgi:hypothetical protein
MPFTCGKASTFMFAALVFSLHGCLAEIEGPSQEVEALEDPTRVAEESQWYADVGVTASVNLTNEAVSRTSSCSFDGCSVVFTNRICNRGTTTAFGSNVAGKWGTNGNIHSACTGYWNAQNTFSSLAANSCRDVIIYGPGYVGPKLPQGTFLTYTGMVDFYCTTAETNEGDNSKSSGFSIP